MKRWAALTVLQYALALLVLTAPVLFAALGSWPNHRSKIPLRLTLELFRAWAYWLWLAIMVAAQMLLLLLPIDLAERRLPARCPLNIPIIVTA
jgi:hypothetical protein